MVQYWNHWRADHCGVVVSALRVLSALPLHWVTTAAVLSLLNCSGHWYQAFEHVLAAPYTGDCRYARLAGCIVMVTIFTGIPSKLLLLLLEVCCCCLQQLGIS